MVQVNQKAIIKKPDQKDKEKYQVKRSFDKEGKPLQELMEELFKLRVFK